MRILLTSPVLPPELGGPAIYSASLAKWLAHRGHEVRLIGFGPRDGLALEGGVELRRVRRTALPLRYARMARVLLREVAWCEVAFSSDHLCAPLARALRRTGKPGALRVMIDAPWELASRFGWTARDPDAFRREGMGWRGRLVAGAQDRWWKSFRCLVAPSDYLRGVIEERGVDPQRIVRIDNPFHGALPASVATSRESRTLLVVARLVRWKRVDRVLDEFARFPDTWRLEILGDGPERRALEGRAIALGVATRVHFAGAQAHAAVLQVMQRATALVLASQYEGLSHTLLEAMAVGLPVVATEVGGNRELLAGGARGLALSAEPPWDLGRVLPEWIEAGGGRRCAEAAGEWVRTRHDRDRVFAAVEALLLRIVDSECSREPRR